MSMLRSLFTFIIGLGLIGCSGIKKLGVDDESTNIARKAVGLPNIEAQWRCAARVKDMGNEYIAASLQRVSDGRYVLSASKVYVVDKEATQRNLLMSYVKIRNTNLAMKEEYVEEAAVPGFEPMGSGLDLDLDLMAVAAVGSYDYSSVEAELNSEKVSTRSMVLDCNNAVIR